MSGGISTKISITDGMSAPLKSMYSGITDLVMGLRSAKDASRGAFDGSAIDSASKHMLSAVAQLKAYEDELNRVKQSAAGWQSLGMIEQFDTSGIKRAEQEANAANAAYGRIIQTQQRITNDALNMELLPSNAIGDINALNTKISNLKRDFGTMTQQQSRIGRFNTAGLNQFSSNTENIRRQMARIESLQEEINRAVKNNDIAAVNRGYKELAGLVDNIEGDIKNNTTAQHSFHSALSSGVDKAKGMASSIKYYVGMAVAAMGGVKFTESVDDYTNAYSRLGLLTDNTAEQRLLQAQIYQSAVNARGKFNDSVSNVAKLGLLAGDAFSSNTEIVQFENLMNKSFKVSGASTQERSSGMYQLTQAMAAGKLQGDEFRSIMENAPMLAQAIADYTGKTKGELKEMSSKGTITADIIKGALFSAADDINAKFNTMPKTFGDVGNELVSNMQYKSSIIKTQVNDMLNSDIGISAMGAINSGIDWGILRIQEFLNWIQRTKDIAGPNISAIIGDFKNLANAIAGPNGEGQKFLSTIQRIAASPGTRAGLQQIGGIVTTIAKGCNAAAGAVASLNQRFDGFLPTVITLTVAYKTFQITNSLLVSPINSMLGLIDSSVQRYNNLTGAISGVTQATTLMNAALSATKWLGVASGIVTVLSAFGGLIAGVKTYTETQKLSEQVLGGYDAETIKYAENEGFYDTSTAQQILDTRKSYNSRADLALQEASNYQDEIKRLNVEKTNFLNSYGTDLHNPTDDFVKYGTTDKNEILNILNAQISKVEADRHAKLEEAVSFGEEREAEINRLKARDKEMRDTMERIKNEETDFTDYFGIDNIFGSDNEDKIQKVEVVDTVDIASEDLRYLRDIAEQEAINQFTSKFVQPVVNVQFGEVRETADVDAIAKKLTDGFVAELNTAGEFVHY